MYRNKRVLLIAGGGTLGTYVATGLLDKGAFVDIICLEDHPSGHEKLRYFKNFATIDFLRDFLADNRYDGIVNFIHYHTVEEYAPIYDLLIRSTDHLIFLSSYRVYADRCHPITEGAPRLLDVSEDTAFLETETYALPKARCENFLFDRHPGRLGPSCARSFPFRNEDLTCSFTPATILRSRYVYTKSFCFPRLQKN